MNPESDGAPLRRELKPRQVNLMTLGGAIGVGLFYGSSTTIGIAGPAVLLAYAICGLFIFFMMRALGEMAIHNPVAGSFSRYAHDYIGPRAGFLVGWTYWLMWTIAIMGEVTVAAVYMKFWFPMSPAWAWTLAALVSMSAINLIAVGLFGELEFWFALIKIVAILCMIASGLSIIFFGIGNGGVAIGLSNLWAHGGFAPHGWWAILYACPMVVFSYFGVEMIGLTTGEMKDPQKTFTRVVNSILLRVAIFYIGSLLVVMALYPWDQVGSEGSPFVMIFERLGLRQAAGVMNFVVLTAALSACNSGIFSAGRMMYNLAQQGQAPVTLTRTSKRGIPAHAVIFCFSITLVAVILNAFLPAKVFLWLSAVETFAGLFTWIVILLAHLQFRRQVKLSAQDKLMPWAPYSTYTTLLFFAVIILVMAVSEDTRLALIVGPVWLAGLFIANALKERRESVSHSSQNRAI